MTEQTQQVMETLTALVATWGLRVVGAVALLVLGRVIAGALRRWISRILERSKVDATLVPFLAKMVYYTVLGFVVLAVLGIFGIPTASAVAVFGAAGLAIGLALQGTLSNFSAGVMLLIFRPFKVGDLVEVAGTLGKAEEIGVFTTTINSLDNIRITVPNSQIYGQIIRNYDGNETRRVDLVIGISYTDDVPLAKEVIRKTVASSPLVLAEPEPTVAVRNLGDSSVDLVVRPWCKSDHYWDVWFDLTQRIKEDLEAAGCTIPFPQRDVHLFPAEQAAPVA